MAKSKIQETHTLSVEGSFDLSNLQLEVEEIGIKTLAELFKKFDGEYIKISVRVANEVLE